MNLTPPFISNPDNLTLFEIKELCSNFLGTRKEGEYVIQVFHLLSLRGRDLYIQEIFDSGTKTSCGARRRLDNFVKAGVMRKASRKIEGVKRPVSVYCFQRPAVGLMPIISSPEVLPAYSSEAAGEPMSFEHEKMTLKDPAIDNLICSVLFGALEFNRLGRTQKLDVIVKCYGAELHVTTRCLSGEDKVIARVGDLKIYISVITLCEEIISYRKRFNQPHKNNFALDSRDINALLGRENSGGNIGTVTKSMIRLSDTQFEIKNIPERVRARYGFDHAVQNIDPISNLGIYSSANSQDAGRAKTIYTFSLPEAVYDGLMSDRHTTFRINPEVLRERHEIIFAFHLFCRRTIGNASFRAFEGSITALKSEIAPHLTMDDFKRKLHKGLADCYTAYRRKILTSPEVGQKLIAPKTTTGKQGSPEFIEYSASIYGYHLRIVGDSIDVLIDHSDRYVGNESKRNFIKDKKALRSRKKVLGITNADINQLNIDEIKGQFSFDL